MTVSSKSNSFGRLINKILGNSIAKDRHPITTQTNFVM